VACLHAFVAARGNAPQESREIRATQPAIANARVIVTSHPIASDMQLTDTMNSRSAVRSTLPPLSLSLSLSLLGPRSRHENAIPAAIPMALLSSDPRGVPEVPSREVPPGIRRGVFFGGVERRARPEGVYKRPFVLWSKTRRKGKAAVPTKEESLINDR